MPLYDLIDPIFITSSVGYGLQNSSFQVMHDEEIEVKKQAFLTAFKKTPEQIKQLEVKTLIQTENSICREERRNLLAL